MTNKPLNGDRGGVKAGLPSPYDQDLSKVLAHLDRRTPGSRAKLANDPVTAAYLAAGMRLIERHLGPDAQRTLADPDDESSVERPLLSFLSQRAVAAAVADNPHPFPRMGNVSTMRSTWRSQSDFIADLLRFALWSEHHPASWESTKAFGAIERLIEEADSDFAQIIHELGYHNMMIFVSRARFRLRLVATAAAEGDDVIRAALGALYQGGLASWREVFTKVVEDQDLRLRPGITPDDFLNLLAALVEGIALRALADPSANVVDHGRRRSLLGTGALALIRGCLERANDSDGMSLEESVHDMVIEPARSVADIGTV
ncbi:MAG TPA: hypothetical protein VF069_15515 [Streptosporangiaceae bacterium]